MMLVTFVCVLALCASAADAAQLRAADTTGKSKKATVVKAYNNVDVCADPIKAAITEMTTKMSESLAKHADKCHDELQKEMKAKDVSCNSLLSSKQQEYSGLMKAVPDFVEQIHQIAIDGHGSLAKTLKAVEEKATAVIHAVTDVQIHNANDDPVLKKKLNALETAALALNDAKNKYANSLTTEAANIASKTSKKMNKFRAKWLKSAGKKAAGKKAAGKKAALLELEVEETEDVECSPHK